jgi:hypothetical protein
MESTRKTAWLEVIVFTAIIGVAIAGMQGFASYFQVVFVISVIYLATVVGRLVWRKLAPRD